MDSRQVDTAFDAALKRGLGAAAGHGPDCPEPELLAAYVDETLSPDERARCETHLAACSRCQAQLAALVRTAAAGADSDAAPAAVGWGWLVDWRWLAPAATAAVAILAFWVIEPGSLDERTVPTVAETEMARRAEETPADLDQIDMREADADRRQVPAAPEAEAPAEPSAVAEEPAARSRLARVENAAIDEAARLEQQRLNAPAAITAGAAAERDRQAPARDLVDLPARLAEAERRADAVADRPVASQSAAASVALTAGIEIPTPARSVRWRIAGTRVERSEDGGASWAVQLDAGSRLLAGMAPSDEVCWVVGEGGVWCFEPPTAPPGSA